MSYLDDIYSMSDDTYEDNLSWCFAVAHVIYHHTAEQDILDRMEWRHGETVCGTLYCPGEGCVNSHDCKHDWPECEIAWAHGTEKVSDAELLEFAEMVEAKDREYRANGADR